MKRTKHAKLILLAAPFVLATGSLSGCATLKSIFAVDTPAKTGPISNPFWDYQGPGNNKNETIVLRTKKGDRSVEVELPGSHGAMTDFVIPVSPAFKETGRGLASVGGSSDAPSYGSDGVTDPTQDERFRERKPSITDREITNRFSSVTPGAEGDQREVETALGLVPADDPAPAQDRSYLASLDHVKQLYKYARYEAALLELDEMLRAYPTDPKLYQMRGTLLERVGRTDLAIKSWNQALRLDPANDSLRRFIERKDLQKEMKSRVPAQIQSQNTQGTP